VLRAAWNRSSLITHPAYSRSVISDERFSRVLAA
jgi:hypothetical protein